MRKRDKTNQRRVGQMIRVLARHQRITNADIASALDLSENQLYERLRGDATLSIDELFVIADRLGVEPAHLLENPDDLLHLGRPHSACSAALIAA